MRTPRGAASVALALCFLAPASGCKTRDAGQPSPAAPPGTVVAEVEGERITMAELDHQLVEKMPQDRIFEMRRQVLDEMVLHGRVHALMRADLAHYPPCTTPYAGFVLAHGGGA